MKRLILPASSLSAWAKLHNVEIDGVRIHGLGGEPVDRGYGILSEKSRSISDSDNLLLRVPKDLILGLESVERHAKTDPWLREILEAVTENGRLTNTSPDISEKIGVSNAWTEYVKTLPSAPLPTKWTEEERGLLTGTSLDAALSSKLNSLDREYERLREKTITIPWCAKHWWDSETGALTFDDWKEVDAMYRSRALDLPGAGACMVPILDIANHASGASTKATYDEDNEGNAVLLLREDRELIEGEEVTITYGDKKGACEMVFSYGFIEDDIPHARELFLDVDIPDDDPLKMAKRAIANLAPGFRLYFKKDMTTEWESLYIWLICVNEEDGFEIKVLQLNDGGRELSASWQGKPLSDTSRLVEYLKEDPKWDVFQLRAASIVQSRVESQLGRLMAIEDVVQEARDLDEVGAHAWLTASRLRELEVELLAQAYGDLEDEKSRLIATDTVRQYLGLETNAMEVDQEMSVVEDDFS